VATADLSAKRALPINRALRLILMILFVEMFIKQNSGYDHLVVRSRLSILAGESGVQGLPPLPEREVPSHHSSSKIPRKDETPVVRD
jgi:hypothetical protein